MAEKCSNYSVVNTKENKTGNVCKVTEEKKHASFMDNTKTWFGKVKKKKNSSKICRENKLNSPTVLHIEHI